MLDFNTYLQTLSDLHPSDECVLVGIGLELPKLLLEMEFQKIVVAEADLKEIKKVSKVYDLSERFLISDALIAKDDTDAKFHIASNPSANTFTDIEKFKDIYPNIELRQTLEKPSISLKTFMSNNNNLKNPKWLILNTLNSKAILEQNDFNKFDVVVCKIKKSERSEVQTKLEENDFKYLRYFEKQNPKILWSIFVKDTKKLTVQKEQELQEKLKQAIKDKDKIIEDLLLSKKRIIPESYLSTIDQDKKIDFISSYCLMQDDILDAIDSFILDSELNENEKFDLCCSFAIKIAEHGDKYQGVSFLNNARYFLDKASNKEQYKKLIELASSLDSVALAVDLEMEFNEKYGDFSPEINKKIFEEYKNIRSISLKKQAHGHDLLIEYIEKHVKDNDQTGKILIEIGTTRENIPGQGSTMQLAQLCKRKNIRFITVDMDKHNSRWATFISHKYNLNITAITKKGEDYLKDDIKNFDFVFLDAYDFDHGMHSELRQSRYEQSLGAKIDEEACHLMHLECAKSVVKKLQKKGVVCVDDTWLDEDENWTAKGTLAVPFLLDNGYEVIEQRNRALLLKKRRLVK